SVSLFVSLNLFVFIVSIRLTNIHFLTMSNLPKKTSSKTGEWDLETRMRVVLRHEDGWSQYKIADSFDPPLSRATVQSIIKAYKENGTVVNKARSGRPALLDEDDLAELMEPLGNAISGPSFWPIKQPQNIMDSPPLLKLGAMQCGWNRSPAIL